jgi:hypothetical protein
MTNYLDPADKVIRAFGGATSLGGRIGLHRTQIHRWRLSKERGGCGGVIPRAHHERLIELAKESKIALTTSDLIPWVTLTDEVLSQAGEAA